MKTIKVRLKQVYGVDTLYPVCDTAHTFTAFAETKTLRKRDIYLIKKLGFDVELVNAILDDI